MPKISCIALVCFFAGSGLLRADNWPGWRGPHQNGVAEGRGYATSWGPTKNVAWKFDLPGAGSSTPAVWADSIFLTCADQSRNAVLCLDRAGQQRWRTAVGTVRPGKHKKATGCNPSPVTDGELVFAYFKSGDLACLDFQGSVLWQTNLQQEYGEDTLWWDLGTSPVLTGDLVVVAVMHSGPSYLLALHKRTGELAWKQTRDLDAPREAAQSYSTPIVLEQDGREIIVVLGADHVTAHEAATGKEIWRAGGLNPTGHEFYRSIASPVVVDRMVIAPYARAKTVTGVQLGGRGDVTESHVKWTSERIGTDVPTPIGSDGKVYVCSDKGTLACLDAETGKELWRQSAKKNRHAYSASPILADGKIYATREDGTTFVFDAVRPEGPLAENSLDELTVATPVFVDGQILIRTVDRLYCIVARE